MNSTTHIPPFAEPLSPPPPLLVLLQATDLPKRQFKPLLMSEDLPLKNIRFHPYRSGSHARGR